MVLQVLADTRQVMQRRRCRARPAARRGRCRRAAGSATEPMEPAERMTSPRQRAAVRLRRPGGRRRRSRALPSKIERSTRQPVSTRRFGRASTGFRKAARGRPAPAAPLVDVEIAEPSLSPPLKSSTGGMPACVGRVAKRVEDVPAHARRFDPPLAAGTVMLRWRRGNVLVLLEERQHVVPAPAGEARAAASGRSRPPGRACRSSR